MSADSSSGSSLELVVKNTFLTVIDVPPANEMQRSASDSDLSSSQRTSSTYGRTHKHQTSLNHSGLSEQFSSGSEAGQVDASGSSLRSSVESGSSRPVRPMAGQLDWAADHIAQCHSDDNSDAAGAAQSTGVPPSKGSALHEKGKCKPCLYYLNGKDKCLMGADCQFCHEFHKKKRTRPKRKSASAQAQGQGAASSSDIGAGPGPCSQGDGHGGARGALGSGGYPAGGGGWPGGGGGGEEPAPGAARKRHILRL
mmetsp:Transcript_24523/g.70944  ORF Transcript_24523/g.70944 Transcript_24523/m.70944 type:complete len:254 (-) Transcript_24523:146-907(-)